MLSSVLSAAVHGVEGLPIHVEVDFRFGLPGFNVVGLPDTSVRESRERVVAAIKNSGFSYPPQRITVNLAPGHIRKEGPSFDFAIAMGILGAADLVSTDITSYAYLGELGLNGEIRPVKGVLPCALGLKKLNLKGIFVPVQNAQEGALVEGIPIYPVSSLHEAVQFISGTRMISPATVDRKSIFEKAKLYPMDFNEVKGQLIAKRALEIAACGGHNVLLIGPPGSGKTLLARRYPSILPDLSFDEALETTKIHSISGYLRDSNPMVATRPFRSPHHGVSRSALIGGGSYPKPGEVSLAHRGVLFLDEFPEFTRDVLEALRQPLEDRHVTISRVAHSVTYPSDFVLVAAANPCPCGYAGSEARICLCTPPAIQKYRAKFSGPLLDRIDLHVDVPLLKVEELTQDDMGGEPSSQIRDRVMRARKIQSNRYQSLGIYENGQLSVRQLKIFCKLSGDGKKLLAQAIKKLGLSARSYDRLLRVARTIADLDGAVDIQSNHLSEAISYRILDRHGSLN